MIGLELNECIYWFTVSLARVVLRLVLTWRVTGLEHVPRSGPLIVVVNHTSFLDVILTGLVIPRHMTALAKVEALRWPILGGLLRVAGLIPVRRGEVDRRALQRALDTVKRGIAFGIAPEGTRSKDGCLQRGRLGIAYLAIQADVPILPMAMWGSPGRLFWKNLARLQRTHIEVVIGEPFVLVRREGEPSRQVMQRITDEIMYRIAALLPPEYRGVYADVANARLEYTVPWKTQSVRV